MKKRTSDQVDSLPFIYSVTLDNIKECIKLNPFFGVEKGSPDTERLLFSDPQVTFFFAKLILKQLNVDMDWRLYCI